VALERGWRGDFVDLVGFVELVMSSLISAKVTGRKGRYRHWNDRKQTSTTWTAVISWGMSSIAIAMFDGVV
jgi:hypothetical protein